MGGADEASASVLRPEVVREKVAAGDSLAVGAAHRPSFLPRLAKLGLDQGLFDPA